MTKRLYLLLALSSCLALLLFAALHRVDEKLQHQLTEISPAHQQQLLDYARQAEALYTTNDQVGAETFFNQLERQHKTWAAVLSHEQVALLGTQVPKDQLSQLSFQPQNSMAGAFSMATGDYWDSFPKPPLPVLSFVYRRACTLNPI